MGDRFWSPIRSRANREGVTGSHSNPFNAWGVYFLQVTMRKKLSIFIKLTIITAVMTALLAPGSLGAEPASPGGDVMVDDLIAENPDALLVYAGAGLKKPVQAIGSAFTNQTGIPVVFNFQGSGNLLTQMEITRKGDIFIPGGTADFTVAEERGLVGDPEYLAYHVPVIAVRDKNPLNISSVGDFTMPGLKLGLGDIKATAIGAAGEKLFTAAGIREDVEKNVVVRAATINELVTALNAGSIDASLLTRDQINEETMDAVALADGNDYVLIIPIGVTTFTKEAENAEKFVEFFASEDGKAFFGKAGFPVYPNETYADVEP